MYQPGSKEFQHHIATYGLQNEFGYKDFIPMFKAEHFDPQAWAQLFREAGFQATQADLFYRELASMRKVIREERPPGSEIRAWPHGAHVLLRLKEN